MSDKAKSKARAAARERRAINNNASNYHMTKRAQEKERGYAMRSGKPWNADWRQVSKGRSPVRSLPYWRPCSAEAHKRLKDRQSGGDGLCKKRKRTKNSGKKEELEKESKKESKKEPEKESKEELKKHKLYVLCVSATGGLATATAQTTLLYTPKKEIGASNIYFFLLASTLVVLHTSITENSSCMYSALVKR